MRWLAGALVVQVILFVLTCAPWCLYFDAFGAQFRTGEGYLAVVDLDPEFKLKRRQFDFLVHRWRQQQGSGYRLVASGQYGNEQRWVFVRFWPWLFMSVLLTASSYVFFIRRKLIGWRWWAKWTLTGLAGAGLLTWGVSLVIITVVDSRSGSFGLAAGVVYFDASYAAPWNVVAVRLPASYAVDSNYGLCMPEGSWPQWALPLWIPITLSGVLAVYMRRVDRPPVAGHCGTCGYDLTGNASGTCPECGRTLDGAEA